MSIVAFSVVICTRNRAGLLADVVASLRAQDYPPELYEILVLDGASTDGTRAEVERLQALPGHPVRYILEPRVGLSLGRNTGAEQARGDVVVYIDDDALADPGWLKALSRPFDRDAGLAGAGGRIKVRWEAGEPDWFLPRYEGFFGGTGRLGEVQRDLAAGEHLFGGNLAVRRSWLEAVGGFSTDLGPGLASTGFGDDTEFCRRIQAAGGRLAYVPDALVYHRIFPDRTTRRYMLRRAVRTGMSEVVMAQLHEQRPRWRLLAAAAVDTLRLPGELLTVGLRRIAGEPREAFARFFLAASRFGRIRQELKLALSPSRSPQAPTPQHGSPA